MINRLIKISPVIAVAILLFLILVIAASAQQLLPTVPGAVNPAVTQQNIHSTICIPGWSKTVRPKVAYTNKLKLRQIKEFGFRDTNPTHYEEDHDISLSLGGHPTSPENLWPQAYAGEWGARTKDKLENKLHKLVCNGTITLGEAQRALSENWIESYKHYMKDRK